MDIISYLKKQILLVCKKYIKKLYYKKLYYKKIIYL